jgi:hypothetical protein
MSSRRSVKNRCGRPGGRTCPAVVLLLLDLFPHKRQIKRSRNLEGPRERLATLGEVETSGHRVQMRPTAGCPMSGIREDTSSGNRHP